MAPESDVFSCSGLSNLTSIDWNKLDCRTSVASSLVNGVYMLEQDAQKKRVAPESRDSRWWEFFNFSLLEKLIEKSDSSIYGAVFKYNSYDADQNTPHLGIPPRYVIAFRGTMLKPKTWFSDGTLDACCVFDSLQHGARFEHALKVIETYVARYGNTTIWLAGHSLGAGLALLAGKTMARYGLPLEAHIFNPPISSVLLKVFMSDKLKFLVRIVGTNVTAGIVKATGRDKGQKEESFMRLASWRPYLYVNSSDPICSEYTRYFKDRIKISEMGAEKIVKLATRFTRTLHFLPSAYVITNTSNSKGWQKAHELSQWWVPISDVKLYELYL